MGRTSWTGYERSLHPQLSALVNKLQEERGRHKANMLHSKHVDNWACVLKRISVGAFVFWAFVWTLNTIGILLTFGKTYGRLELLLFKDDCLLIYGLSGPMFAFYDGPQKARCHKAPERLCHKIDRIERVHLAQHNHLSNENVITEICAEWFPVQNNCWHWFGHTLCNSCHY